jgi:hypothetical protein
MIDDETIRRVLRERESDLEEAAKELVRLANKAGGEDNITVVAFEITEEPVELEQTRPMPAVSDPEPEPKDDEDTLDESDAVPAVDTIVLSPSEAARLQGSSERRKRKHRRRWPWFLLLLLIAAAAVAVVLWVLSR